MKFAQSCPNVRDPKDYKVHGILQARILEWVTVPFYRGSSQPRDQTQVSCIAGRFFTSWDTREALYIYIYIYTLNSITKSPIVKIKNGQKIKINISPPKKTLKYVQHHFSTWKCKSKPKDTTSYLLEWLLSSRQEITDVGEDVKESEPSYTVGKKAN